MRIVDDLISRARFQSDNEQSSSTSGVLDVEVVEFFNDALAEVMPVVLEHDANTLQRENIISLVAGQEAYDLPADIYAERFVEYAEYSNTGQTKDYVPIDITGLSLRDTSTTTAPVRVIVRNDQILVNPIPQTSSGSIRLQYQARPVMLSKRQGTCATVNSSGGYYTTIVLSNDSVLDQDGGLSTATYISFVDSYGVVTYSNFQVASWDSGTRTITAKSSTEATADGTIAVGNYVVLGQYASTHLDESFGRIGEQYLVGYAAMELLRSDSNSDYSAQQAKTARLQSQLVNSLTYPIKRRTRWPISDAEILG